MTQGRKYMCGASILGLLAALSLAGAAQGGVVVGLDFVEQAEPIDFLNPVLEYHFMLPWQMTDPNTDYVLDGAFAGKSETEVQAAIFAKVKEKFYSVVTPAGTALAIDFLCESVSGADTVNVLLGEYNYDREGVSADHWFGRAMLGAGTDSNGDNDAAVALDEIAMLPGPFDTFDKAVNAIANVTAHETGHLYWLEHVMAAEGAPEWEPGDVVVTDPYDVMATGPSGLPNSGWLEDNIFTTVAGTQSGGQSSAGMLIQIIGLRDLGDVDEDGDVDNIDSGAVYGNFTGPGDQGKIWADGNFDHDGDVDNVDFGALLGGFTGPLAGNATDTANHADLIYDPATGNVKLDPSEAAGGVITNWAFENAATAFNAPGVVVFPTVGYGMNTDTAGQISQTDVTMAGFGYLADLGDIFPTGLTLEGLQSLLTTASYVGTVGSGQLDFDLIVIPEPGALVLLCDGATGLLVFGRHRRIWRKD